MTPADLPPLVVVRALAVGFAIVAFALAPRLRSRAVGAASVVLIAWCPTGLLPAAVLLLGVALASELRGPGGVWIGVTTVFAAASLGWGLTASLAAPLVEGEGPRPVVEVEERTAPPTLVESTRTNPSRWSPPAIAAAAAASLRNRATAGFFVAGAALLACWPLSSLWLAGRDEPASLVTLVLTSSAGFCLLARACDIFGGNPPGQVLSLWVHVAIVSHGVAALLAFAHTTLRVRLVALLLAANGWTVVGFASEPTRTLALLRWSGLAAAALAAGLLIEGLARAYRSCDVADFRGLARVHPLWSLAVAAAFLLMAGPLPLLDATAARLLAPVPLVSSTLMTVVTLGGGLTLAVALTTIGRVLFGRLDRPLFDGPQFDGSRPRASAPTRLLGSLETMAVAVLLGVSVVLSYGLVR